MKLRAHPPLVWPEPRCLAGQADYATHPPFEAAVSTADLVACVLVGVADIFGDAILKDRDPRRARAELDELAKIETGDGKPKEKCAAAWKIIAGETKS